MLAYRYDMFNYKYIGTINCQKDPIASKRKGEDVWLLPAHSTFIKPLPSKDGFDVVWNGSTWEYQEIPKPEPDPEPLPPTHEDIEKARIAYRREHIDNETLCRLRKQANGTWTQEMEDAYLALDAEVTAYIEEHLPYPTDPITQEQSKEK